MTNRQNRPSPSMGGSILGIVMLAGFLLVVWFFVKGLFSVLSIVAPILLIATLFINHNVVFDYVKFIGTTIKKDPLRGILYGAGTFFGFPLVMGYLFVKAILARQFEKRFGKKKVEFDEYEEVEEQVVDDEDFLELPEIEKEIKAKPQSRNEYDDLF